jgi:hypothetical protein
VWKLAFMASTNRKLVFQKNLDLQDGPAQPDGWAKPIPRIVEYEEEPRRDIETDVANHDCAKHPLRGEDFS